MDQIHNAFIPKLEEADFGVSKYNEQHSDEFGAQINQKLDFLLESMYVAFDQKRDDESEFLHELDSDLPSAGHQKTREDRQRRTSDEHAEAHDRGTFRAPLLIESDSSDSEESDDDLRGEHLPLAAHLRRNLKGKKPEGTPGMGPPEDVGNRGQGTGPPDNANNGGNGGGDSDSVSSASSGCKCTECKTMTMCTRTS